MLRNGDILRMVRAVAGATLFTGLAGCYPLNGPTPVVAQCSTPMFGTDARPGAALVGQHYGMQMSPLPLNSVQYDSSETAHAMAVQQLYAERTATNSVRVTARFVSCMDRPQVVRMRTTFLRQSQASAEEPTTWKTVHLTPRGLAQYEELSVSPDAHFYLIEVAR